MWCLDRQRQQHWELVRHPCSGLHPKPTKSGTPEVGPVIHDFQLAFQAMQKQAKESLVKALPHPHRPPRGAPQPVF